MSKNQDEPIFMAMSNSDPAMISAIASAKSSLPGFHRAIVDQKFPGAFFNVKGYFSEADGSKGAHIWLWVRELTHEGLICIPFELPTGFTGLAKDEFVLMTDDDIEDWMINNDGELYGGYSLRVQRSLIPEEERASYDEHVGVKRYMDKL